MLSPGLSVASESSETSGHHAVFSSPYKKFVKFKVTWNMIAEAWNVSFALIKFP